MENMNLEIEETLTKLILVIIETGYYYNKENELVMTKSREQLFNEINDSISNFCANNNVEEKLAKKILAKSLKNLGELKHNPKERNLAMDILEIHEEDDDNDEIEIK